MLQNNPRTRLYRDSAGQTRTLPVLFGAARRIAIKVLADQPRRLGENRCLARRTSRLQPQHIDDQFGRGHYSSTCLPANCSSRASTWHASMLIEAWRME